MQIKTMFFGWKVVAAAFVVATFAWGVGFYGPPVFLHVIHEERGWEISTVSAAITSHYLCGALFVINLPRIHGRFGLLPVTLTGGLLTAVGFVGWALATEPWHLFAATVFTGLGWAATGGAAINAFVAPWFIRKRPLALSLAYNGASVGGIIFSALWVVLIGSFGFPTATVLVGLVVATTVTALTVRYLAWTPAQMGLTPDGSNMAAAEPDLPTPTNAALPGAMLYFNRQFITVALGMSLGLFAQIGLIAHLYSMLVPALGEGGAGMAMSYATVCAVIGRTAIGWLISPSINRRMVAALGYGLQILGCCAFLLSAGVSVTWLLLGITLFGSGIGNATSLPPLIAQVEFTDRDASRVVAMIMGLSQAGFAFAPAVFGLVREAFQPALSTNTEFSPAFFVAAALVQLTAATMFLIGRGTVKRA